MTAKVYELLKELTPRIIEYKQSSNLGNPNAKVNIKFSCPLEHENKVKAFVEACNNAPDEECAEIVGNSMKRIFFEVMSSHDFTEKVIADIL